ncbi:MAG: multicopper oxidase domain-containing protein [Anaerolineae bacterium]
MLKRATKRVRLGLLLLAGVLIAALLPGVAIGRPWLAPAAAPLGQLSCASGGPNFNLKTASGHISTPDGNSVFMWGYSQTGDDFQMPGPVLCVNQGQTVNITLTNNDPGIPDPVSIIFPGQVGVTASGGSAGLFTAEAAPGGGTVSYTFVASEPGTYLYESGSEADKQVQMGLYGALIVRPAGHADWAYNDSSTQFSQEYLLVMHDIDPFLHQAVERGQPYDVTKVADRYWTINGRSFPDTVSADNVDWLPSQPYGSLVRVEASANQNSLPTLIRYANAGMVNHPFHPHGNHMRVIARDGRLLNAPFEDFTRTVGSGQSYDLLWRWVDVEAWNSTSKPLPILIPGLIPGVQNLVFKDGASFYSGNPYLGEKGDFPQGVTVYNQCGEFYFPWHSHALNEFTNFDEGFGGLATLVRVEPPGGCP